MMIPKRYINVLKELIAKNKDTTPMMLFYHLHWYYGVQSANVFFVIFNTLQSNASNVSIPLKASENLLFSVFREYREGTFARKGLTVHLPAGIIDLETYIVW